MLDIFISFGFTCLSFFIFKRIILGSNSSVKSTIIFSVGYGLLLILPNISFFIRSEQINTDFLVETLLNVGLIIGNIFYVLVKSDNGRRRLFKKYRDVSFYKLSLIRLISLLVFIVGSIGYVLLIVLFDEYNGTIKVTLFVLLLILLVWILFLNIYILKSKITSEKIIIVNKRGYEVFEVTTKNTYKLSEYIDTTDIYIDKSIRGIFTDSNNNSSFVKIYFIPKHKFSEDIIINNIVLNQILNCNKIYINLVDKDTFN